MGALSTLLTSAAGVVNDLICPGQKHVCHQFACPLVPELTNLNKIPGFE